MMLTISDRYKHNKFIRQLEFTISQRRLMVAHLKWAYEIRTTKDKIGKIGKDTWTLNL